MDILTPHRKVSLDSQSLDLKKSHIFSKNTKTHSMSPYKSELHAVSLNELYSTFDVLSNGMHHQR